MLSVGDGILEHVFESKRSSPEVIARFDEEIERCYPSKTAESAALVEEICASSRQENQAAAAQLAAIGRLFGYRLSRCSDTEDWAVDTVEAVAAEVAAALRISQGLAASRVRYARAMRERLPQVAEMFKSGDIDYRTFQTLVYRTDLIEDRQVLAAVDAALAANVGRWPSMSRGRLAGQVDKIVAKADVDAVRRRAEARRDREVWIGDRVEGGISEIHGSLFTPDAHALDKRLDALAATVCARDPRTREQRRADALGALAAGADRLGCRCGRPDCAAGTRPPASPVVIHVIAEQATLEGTGGAPGSEVGADGLIPPELVAELAASAKLMPLIHPGDAPPENGYVPSKALADFVRSRDLTCRWPGCDHPAIDCDVDHTIPYALGGLTHASNLKCYCRIHHLIKTFLGWAEQQLADGTLILTSPAGQTHVTTPGSALLFPSLCRAVGGFFPAPEAEPPADYCAERTAMMPRRRRTRAQDRAYRVAAERRHNREAREARTTTPPGDYWSYGGPAPPPTDDDPPF
ncbi:hypothetical protein A5696_15340 [Mycobacterium sp. E2699]|uniref:HNH endonuclease signature motif containing protein n=1 Tax=Mycobacterium sp. E2699 TaxID=1834137 RepID=UPI0007FF5CA6|nr:HNH endonuclease signature motif containing protein [Mycobacterium sp. E2699]OBH00734.1 hypothetical protein A5696_15340 [Mycobacterium sp. E2699]